MKYMCRHVIQLCNDRPRQDDTDTRGGIQEGGERWKRERREEKRSGMKVVREVDGSYSKKKAPEHRAVGRKARRSRRAGRTTFAKRALRLTSTYSRW